MSDTSHKPTAHREFRLEVHGWSTNALPWDSSAPNQLTVGEEIHVIEYSAVQELLDALEKLVPCTCQSTLLDVLKAHPSLMCKRCKTLTKFREGKAR